MSSPITRKCCKATTLFAPPLLSHQAPPFLRKHKVQLVVRPLLQAPSSELRTPEKRKGRVTINQRYTTQRNPSSKQKKGTTETKTLSNNSWHYSTYSTQTTKLTTMVGENNERSSSGRYKNTSHLRTVLSSSKGSSVISNGSRRPYVASELALYGVCFGAKQGCSTMFYAFWMVQGLFIAFGSFDMFLKVFLLWSWKAIFLPMAFLGGLFDPCLWSWLSKSGLLIGRGTPLQKSRLLRTHSTVALISGVLSYLLPRSVATHHILQRFDGFDPLGVFGRLLSSEYIAAIAALHLPHSHNLLHFDVWWQLLIFWLYIKLSIVALPKVPGCTWLLST